MKKIITMLFICILTVFVTNVQSVSAGSTSNASDELKITSKSKPLKNFSISKGLEATDEYTFDSKRIVTGVADIGSKINISVFKNTAKDKNELVSSYETIVGQSGIFNITIDLFVGENIIVIDAINKDLHNGIDAKINRLNYEIKQELEIFSLPGQKF